MTDKSNMRPEWFEEARERALELLTRAYAPYSSFPVAAVLVAADGALYGGVNVENATYGATMCAERSAIGAAVTAGQQEFVGVVVTTRMDKPTPPCGICRQVLLEFAPKLDVYSVGASGAVAHWTLDALLPSSFSATDLS